MPRPSIRLISKKLPSRAPILAVGTQSIVQHQEQRMEAKARQAASGRRRRKRTQECRQARGERQAKIIKRLVLANLTKLILLTATPMNLPSL